MPSISSLLSSGCEASEAAKNEPGEDRAVVGPARNRRVGNGGVAQVEVEDLVAGVLVLLNGPVAWASPVQY